MGKYIFAEDQRIALEKLQIPFAVYQFTDKRVVTLLLSDGFCELFGYDDRDSAVFDMDNDMYKDVHPDDAARIADAAYRFATAGGQYEVIYRSKKRDSSEYNIIHALGKHVYAEDGTRLAHIWYTLEGTYSEQYGMHGTKLDQVLTSALHEESLMRAGFYDDLTGLPGMTYFFDLAEAGRSAMLDEGIQPVLLYMDLSGLKFYNQKYGFNEGNKALQSFAKILGQTFSNENCGRFGQDHFAVFTSEERLAERLEQFFTDCERMNDGNSLPVRVGIYSNRMESVNVSTACDRAKVACDELRGTYISGFRYYDEKLKEELELRNYILENIDRALEEGWIRIYYQPIVRAVSGIVCDDEALSRWFDPIKGLLSPAEFIPVLEDAGLIYKLDLYVVDRVLEKMKIFSEKGLFPVPHSINLSRSDFASCDIVEEIRRKVDASGFGRDMITIEITETTIGRDFDFMKKQIERFRELGFRVWIDDFGSGYSSLNVLQSVEFDLIKFDMQFMRSFNEGGKSRIILSELMKMAAALGVDTVCEGVETEEQVTFLKEIGCSKLQGFYFRAPSAAEQILERYENGTRIGYENPAESVYYETIGRVSLHDMAFMGSTDENDRRSMFNGMPMAIMEVRNGLIRYVRTNRPYREFMQRLFGYDLPVGEQEFLQGPDGEGSTFMKVLYRCAEDEERAYFNEPMPDGSVVHALFKRLAVDPVTGTAAVGIAVLSITDAKEVTTYESLVKALSADYINIFYVNLETDHYIEYSSTVGGEELYLERHGDNFFEEAGKDAKKRLYPEDRPILANAFTKKNILEKLEQDGTFSITYRLLGENGPFYASMSIALNHRHGDYMVIGVRNVDTEMRQREAIESIRREQVVFSRITALSGEYISLFVVDPETEQFVRYEASAEFAKYGFEEKGWDFFEACRADSRKVVCPEDLSLYLRFFNKENVMHEIEENGIFVLSYSIIMNRVRVPVCLRIAKVQESDGEKLIVGLNRSNEQMLQESRGKELHSLKTAPDAKAPIDYQYFADCVNMPCCIMSVEKAGVNGYGKIRIIKANHAYKRAMGPEYYYDNVPYDEFVPQNNQFEDYCYRSAILGERVHAYVESRPLGCWIDEALIPLESDREDMGYCQFIFEVTDEADAARLATVSARNAEEIIKASIKLLGADDLQESVGNVLDDIMKISDAEGSRIMLVDHDNKEAVIFSERFKEDAWPDRKRAAGEDIITYELIKTWEEAIGLCNQLVIRNEADMQEVERSAPAWVRTMRESNVRNLLLIPLRSRNELIGYLYVVNFDPKKEVEVKELLELLAFYFGTEIFNHLLMHRLERISEVDVLTGMNNRRAMTKRTDKMKMAAGSGPFGVVNIDLNGLKFANDQEGHEAGDNLLIRAAELLRMAFRKDDLFRTGGDEFLVIADGIGKELFEEKVKRLHDLGEEDPVVSFAMGSCWSDGTMDLETALGVADELMYEDKKTYYEKHPEKKR